MPITLAADAEFLSLIVLVAIAFAFLVVHWMGVNHHKEAVRRVLEEKGYGERETKLALEYRNWRNGLLFAGALPDRNAVALGRLGAKVDERKAVTGAIRLCQNCRSAELDSAGVCPLCRK